MTVYVLAQLTFTDRPAYDRYMARFMETFAPFGGRVLAAQENPHVLEGDWTGDKVVLLEFPDAQTMGAWAMSPGYREIARDRRAGATGPVLLLEGFIPQHSSGGASH